MKNGFANIFYNINNKEFVTFLKDFSVVIGLRSKSSYTELSREYLIYIRLKNCNGLFNT